MAFRPRPAGHFRHRISIERRSTVSDGMGGTTESWSTVASGIACRIEEARGGEAVQSNRVSSIANVDIHIRWTSEFSLGSGDRLRNDRTDEIYSVKWVGSLDELERDLLVVATRGEVSNA